MKYTLLLPDLDKTLTTVDEQVHSAELVSKEVHALRGSLWLADSPLSHPQKVNNASYSEEVRRRRLLVSPKQKDGSRFIATPFGSMRILLQRGGGLDSASGGAAAKKSVKSSMPGKVMKVYVSVGDIVKKDQPVLTIEAMKMENEIRSPMAGVVTEVAVIAGQTVETGQVLFKIENQK